MARPRRTAIGSVKDELFRHPYRFEFFQAVRLLWLIRSQELGPSGAQNVGENASPQRECVHLKGILSHRFPAVEVGEIKDSAPAGVPELSVAVMGLYGAMGVLPTHDTQRLIDKRRDTNGEVAFLDLFNHRVLSLFYRAWAKHFLPVNYEQSFHRFPDRDSNKSNLDGSNLDVVSNSLLALAGAGLPSLQNRLEFADTTFAFFAGHFSRQPKAASSLAQMIRVVFDVPVTITHFVGQWLQLNESTRSEMASPERIDGQNAQLGSGFILGDRVWDIGGKFRVTLGPLDYQQMLSYCPWNEKLKRLFQLTKAYVGPQLEFDIQLELHAAEIPPLQLGSLQALGTNSWLYSSRPTQNSRDATFRYPHSN